MIITVIPNNKTADGKEAFLQVCKTLSALPVTVTVPADTAFPPRDMAELLSGCDVAIAIGGDGTIIHTAKQAAAFGKPVLGINSGRLGFTAGLERTELGDLSRLITGEYDTEERMLLDITVDGENGKERFSALNEAVISRGALSRMIEVSVQNNGEPVSDYQADGVIVATPTGSTAYSLSAGGPIVDTALRCLLLTPICPHSLHSRPYIFEQDAVLTLTPLAGESPVFVTVDGEEAIRIQSGGAVCVKRSDTCAKLIKLHHKPFYQVLDDKLTNRKG
ncbi:MAG: NAD(+)/NADH kinase [Clostridia bacterium]|nr:NAD(+)/NADH kinase [Clostridia bacterium]